MIFYWLGYLIFLFMGFYIIGKHGKKMQKELDQAHADRDEAISTAAYRGVQLLLERNTLDGCLKSLQVRHEEEKYVMVFNGGWHRNGRFMKKVSGIVYVEEIV